MVSKSNLEDILKYIKTLEFLDVSNVIKFWEEFDGDKISYYGINFKNETLDSVKYYLTIYSNNFPLDLFPISLLKAEFIEDIIFRDHNFCNSKYTNGGGVTFVIKYHTFSQKIEIGYYFRTNKGHQIENIVLGDSKYNRDEFIDSFGLYRLIDSDLKKTTHTYGYLDPKKLKNQLLVGYQLWNLVRGVEIAKINDVGNEKIILLGGEDLYDTTIINKIPPQVIDFRNSLNLNFVCPAFKMDGELCSVYLTDFSNNSRVYL
jgi:hypothetical protein